MQTLSEGGVLCPGLENLFRYPLRMLRANGGCAFRQYSAWNQLLEFIDFFGIAITRCNLLP